MADKDALADKAGVDDPSKVSKAELEGRVEDLEAAGPFVGDEDQTFVKKGATVTGVQALTEDDIPEAGL